MTTIEHLHAALDALGPGIGGRNAILAAEFHICRALDDLEAKQLAKAEPPDDEVPF